MVKIEYDYQMNGKIIGSNESEATIGNNAIAPYELLMGALVSCLYSTFLEIANKNNLVFKNVVFDVEYSKLQKKIPSYLEKAEIQIKFSGANQGDFAAFEDAIKKSADFCSIYQTLSKKLGAELSWSLELS